MSALDSPHRLADDANGTAATPLQHLSGQVLALYGRSEDHETRIGVLEARTPYRGLERGILLALLVAVAVTMGAMLGLLHYAHELVQHLPR